MIRTRFSLAMPLVLQAPAPVAGADRSSSQPARSKSSQESRAKARLEKIKPLINAGKYKTARRRLRKRIRDYPFTRASLEAGIILSTIED
jgi:hypothetical protein